MWGSCRRRGRRDTRNVWSVEADGAVKTLELTHERHADRYSAAACFAARSPCPRRFFFPFLPAFSSPGVGDRRVLRRQGGVDLLPPCLELAVKLACLLRFGLGEIVRLAQVVTEVVELQATVFEI